MFHFNKPGSISKESQIKTRKRLANLTSNILNPFLLSLTIILLLSFASASSTLEALKWASISAALSVLPLFLVIVYLVRKGSLDAIFTNIRQQRTRIYLLAGLCAVTSCLTLAYSGAPSMLVVASAAAISTALLFMLINLWWKISLHTALVSASATVLIMLYGWAAVATVALVPLTGWSRIELEHHSLAQATTGALLAASIAAAALYPFLPA